MRPMLDDIELPQVQEIRTLERRALAEHKPPGMAGSRLQDLGRHPLRLLVGGIKSGPDAPAFVETLNDRFRNGEPVTFIADIVADAELETVVIDDLRFREIDGKPQRYAYVLTLREYREPVAPATETALDAGILEEARKLMDDLVNGLDIGLAFASGLERFVGPLSELLTRLRNARGG